MGLWKVFTKDTFDFLWFFIIFVENRSGGGGATGMLAGANAKADGTTVTMITVELATLEAMGTNAGLTYSMFKPIMMVNSACAAITVNAKDDRFNTIEDFINYARITVSVPPPAS